MNNESILRQKTDQEIKINDRIRHVFDTTPMLIDYWDKHHQIIDCNIYAMEFYGFITKEEYLRPDPLSLPDYQAGGEASVQSRNNHLDIIFRDGYGKFDFEERKLNGEVVYLEVEGIRVKDAENDDFIAITYAKDVTQFKKNELAMQAIQEELKHREKLLSGLNRAAEALLAADESKRMDVLDDGMNIIGNLLVVGHMQIWLIREMDGQECFTVVHDWGVSTQPWEQNFSIQCHKNEAFFDALFSGNGLTGSTSQLPHELMEYCADYGAASYAMLPMFTEGERAGFFIAYDFANSRIFTCNEMNVLASAGLMFTSVFNHNAQRERAYTDTLTGIYNRRYLMEEAERTLHDGSDFALIIMDIDYFKTINDTYGHATGDEVLQIFASRVKMVIKEGEIFTRYGGEEFVIALPAVTHENALLIAERIRQHIAATPFSTAQGEISVTASCGVASKLNNTCALTEIISRADGALYKAKESGRNIVQG